MERARSVLPVAQIAVASFLLFLVQPMVAKMALPLFGGSPLVWATCLMFFQVVLLLGYGWAHFIASLDDRMGRVLHSAVMVAALATLPPRLPESWAPEPGAWPVGALLVAIARASGPVFFVLAANATLVQHWVARAGREPLRLYAVSNAASLAGLIAYPVIFEMLFGLSRQSSLLSWGFGIFVALGLGVALLTSGAAAPAAVPGVRERDLGTIAGWILRSAAGSMLVVAISVHVTTDVAAAPFLWVAPLGIYLITFVLAFGWREPPSAAFGRLALLMAGALFVPLVLQRVVPLGVSLALDFFGLFVLAWVLHADLAFRRPPAERLTSFYLCMALGGALGGLFGSLLAPILFDSVAEYPLALLLASALIAAREPSVRTARTRAALAVLALLTVIAFLAARGATPAGHVVAVAGTITIVVLGNLTRTAAAAYAGLTIVVLTGAPSLGRLLDSERSFFGLVRVTDHGNVRLMLHGTIVHGAQRIEPPSDVPGTYFHPRGPMARLVASQPAGARVGVVGLGAGSLAHFAPKEGELVFFEIDPTVEEMARKWFSFLSSSPGKVSVVIGDARLTLARQEDASLDLLVIDAFSSDAIPAHLLTVEAIELYFRKSRGVVALHVSNQFLELEPIVSGAARKLELSGRSLRWEPDDQARGEGAFDSHVVVLSKDPAILPGGWSPLVDPIEPWTDERSSVLQALVRR